MDVKLGKAIFRNGVNFYSNNFFRTAPINSNTVYAPILSPSGGSYGSAQSVVMSSYTTGADIWYTTDGSTPSAGGGTSVLYSSAVSVTVTTTLKAIAVKSGMTDSSVTTETYTISAATPASAPTSSLAAGTYDRAMTQAITLTTSSSGASIYYTVDGTTPTTSSTLYTAAIPVDTTTTVKAIASGGGFSDSTVASFVYTIISPQLYIPGNGFNTGTSIVDTSGYARAITVAGNAQFSTAQSKFNGSSILLDGTGDYVTASSSSSLSLGTGDFIQCGWARVDVTQTQLYPDLVSNNKAWGAGAWQVNAAHASAANKMSVWVNTYNSGSPIITGNDIRDAAWHFWMLVRNGTSHKLYVDGAQVGSTYTSSASIDGGGSNAFVVGGNSTDAGQAYKGYQSHVALYVGQTLTDAEALAWYNASVAFAPHPNLLLHADGTNGSTTFTDSSNSALTVTPAGNAQLSTSNPKFGTAAGLFDGTGDYLTLGGQSAFAFGSADWTVEGFVNTAVSAVTTIIDMAPTSTNGAYPLVYINASRNVIYNANAADRITSSATITLNTYAHIAVVRKSGTTTLYVNGVSQGTYADLTVYLNGASRPIIAGSGYWNGLYAWNGLLDELQIINGIAKYTANFTPPTRAFVA